jgi:UDP-N-acetylglucosamine 1-carboxyvinyltransferase
MVKYFGASLAQNSRLIDNRDSEGRYMTRKIVINGGKRISGEVTISGAKNSVVALIPATILANDVVTLDGVPDISDVAALVEIMEIMGAKVVRDGERLVIDSRDVESKPLPYGKINALRASYYFNGALLGRFGEATVGLPGGCDLGPRPIDLHIKAFEALGATMHYKEDAMHLTTEGAPLKAASIYMDMVSVGATINTMLAAVKAEGRTVIENAAREPEIIDVATLLNNMGARIRGAGTDEIRIDGVKELHGASHTVIPDRIEAGTYLALAAAYGDGVKVNNVIFEHMESFISKLAEMGVKMTISDDAIEVHPSDNLKAVNIKTVPYPGFATDLQQPITPLLLMAEGHGRIVDTIYEKRVNHVPELARMGANISSSDGEILYHGPAQLRGTEVRATDLRAGAALVNAGIMATGTTTISNIEFILRGYDHIIEKMQGLGVDIQLIEA